MTGRGKGPERLRVELGDRGVFLCAEGDPKRMASVRKHPLAIEIADRWNAHDSLLAALERLTELAPRMARDPSKVRATDWIEALDKAREALAAAKATGGN